MDNGVPLFNYVYPFPNYVASFLHFLGYSFIDSFKLNIFFATFVGAIFFYLWSKEYWGNLGGVVCSIFYTYSPYHFLDIYIRGSVGEVWSLAIFPALLWSSGAFIKTNKKIYLLISPIILSLLIFPIIFFHWCFFHFVIFYCIFFMLKNSMFIWKIVPFMNYFQFPWRFLSLEILISSFISGSIVYAVRDKVLKIIICLIMVIFVYVLGIGYSSPAFYMLRSDEYYTSNPSFINGTNSPGNYFNTIWMNGKLKKSSSFIIPNNAISYKVVYFDVVNKIIKLNVKSESKIGLNIAYFPGWRIYIDNNAIRTEYNKDGIIMVNITKGEHNLQVRLEDTNIRKLSTVISLFSIFLLTGLFVKMYFVRIKK